MNYKIIVIRPTRLHPATFWPTWSIEMMKRQRCTMSLEWYGGMHVCKLYGLILLNVLFNPVFVASNKDQAKIKTVTNADAYENVI